MGTASRAYELDDEPLGPFRLRTPDGKYLAHTEGGFTSTTEKERAATFETEFGEGQTQQILKVLSAELGTELTIDELTDIEQFEFCDVCGQFGRPTDIFFNGHTFVCLYCRARATTANPQIPRG